MVTKLILVLVVVLCILVIAVGVSPIRIGDYLYHPLYGKYPVEVPYKPGMTLYPGQQTRLSVIIPFGELPPEEKQKTY